MPSAPSSAQAPAQVPARVAVIGGGPAGLMAAETLAAGGASVDVYDAMPSVGRKFLLAGKGGLNLTHNEPFERFVERFGARRDVLLPMLRAFGPLELRAWAHALGIETFVGSSGRVFPTDMKAAPLLRAWLHRLRASGVRFHMRHRWLGWQGEALRFATPAGEALVHADALVLALGGASWPQLGSDGAWVETLSAQGVSIAPLQPSNCGFDGPGWSEHFRSRHAGAPLKNVTLRFADEPAAAAQAGEFVVTDGGVEGSLVYALSARVRERIARDGEAHLLLDLLPALDAERVRAEVARPRGSRSLGTHLKSRLGLSGVKAALLYERLPRSTIDRADELAAAIQAVPLTLCRARPIAEAISTAGGVRFEALDEHLMLAARPGVFCAGEMLDWEAPTGGYLLTASFASGRAAAAGALAHVATAAR